MKWVEFLLVSAAVLITLSIVAGMVYFVFTLIQIKKTVKELERMIKEINGVLCIVGEFCSNATSLTKKLFSPIVSIASVLFCTLSKIIKN
jgi:uncharacterized protein YoxC